MEGLSTGGLAHAKGELVVYRNNGIYRISDIRKEIFCGIGERTYYVMSSVNEKNSIMYVPVDAKDIGQNMRRLLTPEQIDKEFDRAKNSENTWPEDVKERAAYLDKIFDSGSCADMLWLYKILSSYKNETEGNRRKLYASDARILSAAEKIIAEEFSIVLGLDRSAAIDYINEKLLK